MIKYIAFVILLGILILNFTAEKVMKLILRKEVEEKQVITFKLVLYVIMLVGVVYIMFINK